MMTNEIVETVTLDDLAVRIIECSNAADEQLIEAAMLMQQAKDLIETGKGNGLSWQDWVDQNIRLGRSRINELLQLAKSENPREALAQLRQGNKARQARHREKQKAALPLRHGQDAFEISTPVPAETIPATEAPAAPVGEMVTATAPAEVSAAAPMASEASDAASAAFEAWVARLAAWGQSASPEALAHAVALLDEHLGVVVAA